MTGFYFSVLKEGEVAVEGPIKLLHRDDHQVKVADITRLYRQDKYNLDLIRRVVEVEALPEGWREYIQQRIVKLTGASSSIEV